MQNSKPEKVGTTTKSKFTKSIVYILGLGLITYVFLAVITHSSLNNMREDYEFSQSLAAIFDTQTAIFKFVFGFAGITAAIVIFAVLIKFLKDKTFDFRNRAKG